MSYATFGLVGIHIIQRIHQGTGAAAHPQGGTYIFATWEHVGNDKAGFTYSNYFPGQPLVAYTADAGLLSPAVGRPAGDAQVPDPQGRSRSTSRCTRRSGR